MHLSASDDSKSDPLKTSITPPESGHLLSEEQKPAKPQPPAETSGIRTTPPVNAGRVLGGRYQLDAAIGSGGMGDIYRARRLHIGDTVAVKVLRPEVVDNAQSRQRFYREARAAAMLHHPNAVVIHDFGEDSDGTAYIVMELLEGHNLRYILVEEGTLSPERVLDIVRQSCAALEAAHRSGIVHRDIKPDNIMLLDTHSGGDHVKILDFGIAKLRDKALDTLSLEKNLTNVGTVIGTPHYMSPEQCQGEPADARSDIYSLGVVAYEMLTGVTPFVAKTPTGVAIKHVTEPPAPLTMHRPELSPSVERVVLRALEKNAAARQQSALEFVREFTVAVRGESGQTELNTSSERAPQKDVSAETVRFPSRESSTDFEPLEASKRGYETRISGHEATDLLTPVAGEGSHPPVPETPREPVQKATEKEVSRKKEAVAATPKPSRASAATATSKKSPRALIYGGGAAALILVAVLAVVLFRNMSGPANTPVTPVASPQVSVEPTPVTPSTPTPPPGMVFIAGGEFTLGRDDGDPNEKPARIVAVTPFFIDATEVTNEQYQKFIDETKYPAPKAWAGGRFPEGSEKLPVTDVTWEDAMTYARSVGKRLPSEEEWEFAARGTDGRLYPWGATWEADRANSQNTPADKRQLQAVGQFPPGASPFQVLDLSGNVWEWTSSDYVAYPGGFVEPPPPGYRSLKVIRGGSYLSAPQTATATLRAGWPATRNDWPAPGKAHYDQTGFRCAQDAPRP